MYKYRTVQYRTVQYNTVQHSTAQYSTSINIVRLRSNYGTRSLQYSTVQYSTVRYRSINMQVSTQRDQCTLVGNIYRDAHVLELDNRHV